MVRRVLVLLAVFGVVVGVRAQGTGDLKVVLDSYLAIGDQLANDKVDGVKAPADAIAAEAAKMGEKGTALAKAAKAMASMPSPADLAAARKAFGPLSEAVIEATKDVPRGCQACVLPDGQCFVAAERCHHQEPLLRVGDADLWRVPRSEVTISRAFASPGRR